MASYTSFLNLEKPTTSERLDVLKINSNWDKIDAGVSTLNSQIEPILMSVKAITKQSQGSTTTITFTFTGNRYTALVFRTDNSSGASGIYALHYKKGGVQGISTIIGNSNAPAIDSSTGTISVNVNAWSKVVLLGFADDNTAFS